MMRGNRLIRIGLGLGVLLILSLVGLFVSNAGWLRGVTDTPFGTCSLLKDRVGGPAGPEDMAFDPQTGLAYISSSSRNVTMAQGKVDGAIYVIDTKATAPVPERLPGLDPKRFSPHGLDLYITPDGRKRLFVVNHGASGHDHSIEVFDILPDGGLMHAETVRSDLFRSPNDVAAIGPRSFYVSNDPYDSTPLRRFGEIYLALPLGNVVYFNAISARVAADGLAFPNGLLADPVAARLFVAESTGRAVRRFAIAPDGQIQEDKRIGVPMAADNLSRTAMGTVLVTGHPRPLAFNAHARALGKKPSPTLVMELTPELDDARVLYENDGSAVSGGSSALMEGARLFIGSVFGPGVLFCSTAPLF